MGMKELKLWSKPKDQNLEFVCLIFDGSEVVAGGIHKDKHMAKMKAEEELDFIKKYFPKAINS